MLRRLILRTSIFPRRHFMNNPAGSASMSQWSIPSNPNFNNYYNSQDWKTDIGSDLIESEDEKAEVKLSSEAGFSSDLGEDVELEMIIKSNVLRKETKGIEENLDEGLDEKLNDKLDEKIDEKLEEVIILNSQPDSVVGEAITEEISDGKDVNTYDATFKEKMPEELSSVISPAKNSNLLKKGFLRNDVQVSTENLKKSFAKTKVLLGVESPSKKSPFINKEEISLQISPNNDKENVAPKIKRLGNAINQAAVELNLFGTLEDTLNDDDIEIISDLKFKSTISQSKSAIASTVSPPIVRPGRNKRRFSDQILRELDDLLKKSENPTTKPIQGSPISSSPLLPLSLKRSLESPKSPLILSSRQVHTSQVQIPSQISLSDEQLQVLDIIKQGHSIFYTGSAGTGKSVLLRHAIKELRAIYGPGEVAVTASTGLAACNIGGVTLHSFAGIGLGEGEVHALVKKIRKSKRSDVWINTKVLFIDEISMIDGVLLDKLNAIAKQVRRSNEPFGGIQVVFCGDFYQLPPVINKAKQQESGTPYNPDKLFAFQSDTWRETVKISVVLTKVFRQKGDLEFIDMLNEIRTGFVSPAIETKFRELSRPLENDDGIEPAELFSTRREVERANNRRLQQVRGPKYTFNAVDAGSLVNQDSGKRMLENLIAPEKLYLKKGAQVMMIKNIDETLVNGTLGKIIDFIDPDTFFYYNKIKDGEISDDERFNDKLSKKVERPVTEAKLKNPKLNMMESLCEDQKQQTVELDESVFDVFKLFEDHYDLEDPIYKNQIERRKRLINDIYAANQKRRYPLVRFLLNDGNTRDVLVHPETWNVENEFETILVSRTQIPLMLAWAFSIHKSQGQTLSKARMDLSRVFEKGQAYVALSRVVNRKGLQVLNFSPNKVVAHATVSEFYETLLTTDKAVEKATSLSLSGKSMMRRLFGARDPPKLKKTGRVKKRRKETQLKI